MTASRPRRALGGLAAIALLPAFFVSLCGCEREADLRVPYIPPALANWPQPYRGVAGLTAHVFNTGYVRAPEALIVQGGSLMRMRDLAVPAVVIAHPKHGLILFNTGLRPEKDKGAWPSGWMRVVGVDVRPGTDLKSQMETAGLKPDAVRWIVLSSLRFDRAGEVESFPHARVVTTKAEREYASEQSRSYAPDLVDDVAEWKLVDFASTGGLGTFPTHVDLLGDGSCLLLDATGSTGGALAMVVRLAGRPLVLADGLASIEEQVRYAVRPAAAYDMRQWWDHIWRLKRFKDLVPDLVVLPGHDLRPLLALHHPNIVVHEISPPPEATMPAPTPNLLERVIPKPW